MLTNVPTFAHDSASTSIKINIPIVQKQVHAMQTKAKTKHIYIYYAPQDLFIYEAPIELYLFKSALEV